MLFAPVRLFLREDLTENSNININAKGRACPKIEYSRHNSISPRQNEKNRFFQTILSKIAVIDISEAGFVGIFNN